MKSKSIQIPYETFTRCLKLILAYSGEDEQASGLLDELHALLQKKASNAAFKSYKTSTDPIDKQKYLSEYERLRGQG